MSRDLNLNAMIREQERYEDGSELVHVHNGPHYGEAVLADMKAFVFGAWVDGEFIPQ